MKSLIRKFFAWRQGKINEYNKSRLTNFTPTLICSNCTGGLLYHWLGLQFRSPFINLYMSNEDFLTAMENFDEFIEGPIKEDIACGKDYPVGVGVHGERIHFMYYPDFNTAISKWNERKTRIDRSNMAIMLSNLGAYDRPDSRNLREQKEMSIIQRFNALKFKNKIIFTGEEYNMPNVVHLKGWKKVQYKKNIFARSSIFGKRYIDQYDYVSFINNMVEDNR